MMRKFMICFVGAMMAVSLAACSPTQVTREETLKAESINPNGLTPEMVAESNAEQVDPKLMPPDPDAQVLEPVMVYYAAEDGSGLKSEMESAEELTAETVVETLIEYGVLPEGTEVNSFDIEGAEKAGPGVDASDAGSGERIGILDLNQLELDEADEKLVLYAIVNTFSDNFELDKLEILVDGETYDSKLLVDGYLEYVDNYEKIN